MQISLIKSAWRAAYQDRTCPPHTVLMDSNQVENVVEHRKSCPLCFMTNDVPIDSETWKDFGRHLTEGWRKPDRPNVSAGQVWNLKDFKGGWDERFRHINPPLVLVLELLDDVDGVRVAQVFDEAALVHDGDVNLGNGFGFAESWNTYALDKCDLKACFGQVEDEALEAVKTNCSETIRELDDESTIWFFRQLEIEVGAFMAMEALGRLMERYERNAVRQELADVETVLAKVLTINSRIRLPKLTDGLMMLAEAELPDELKLKAAAGEGAQQVSFTVVSVGEQGIPCRGSIAEVLNCVLQDTDIRILGRLPEECREGILFAWWRRPDVGLNEGVAELDPSTGMFSAVFTGKSELDFNVGELVLLLVELDDAEN